MTVLRVFRTQYKKNQALDLHALVVLLSNNYETHIWDGPGQRTSLSFSSDLQHPRKTTAPTETSDLDSRGKRLGISHLVHREQSNCPRKRLKCYTTLYNSILQVKIIHKIQLCLLSQSTAIQYLTLWQHKIQLYILSSPSRSIGWFYINSCETN